MERLEVSIKYLSEITTNDDNTFRIDSEHYQKKYVDILQKIKNNNFKRLDELIIQPVTTGHTPSMGIERYYGGNVKFIKTDNLRENRINAEFNHFLSEEGNKTLSKTSLKKGDIITTIIGATYSIIGRTSIIQEEILPANINQNIALIRIDEKIVNPNYLNIFLNTYYGRNLLYYHSRQTEQVNLNCREVERILIPIFKKLELLVENLVLSIENLKKSSIELYAQAEEILLQEIGLLNFQPSREPVNIKNFKEVFSVSGRLDAEYYQVKYDELEIRIKSQNYVKINNIKSANFRGVQPVYFENGNLDVINSKHILDKSLDYKGFEKTHIKYWDIQERARIFKGDILTYTTGANIGRTQVYNSNEKALASNHVNILRVENQNPIYIGFVMNSIVGKMQTEKLSAGSAQAELYPKDIDNFLIPIIDKVIQLKIVKLINESFELKSQSEKLLEIAKLSVEIAIEKNEKTAIDYINNITL